MDGVEIAKLEPLSREVVHERPRTRVREHPTHLLPQDRRIGQLAPRSGIEQLVVRDATPEKKRETRGQLQVADAIVRIGGDVRWVGLDPKQELRARQESTERHLDARVEATLTTAGGVERHQPLDVIVIDRSPIPATSERCQNRSRTACFVRDVSGPALQDPAPAGRRP